MARDNLDDEETTKYSKSSSEKKKEAKEKLVAPIYGRYTIPK